MGVKKIEFVQPVDVCHFIRRWRIELHHNDWNPFSELLAKMHEFVLQGLPFCCWSCQKCILEKPRSKSYCLSMTSGFIGHHCISEFCRALGVWWGKWGEKIWGKISGGKPESFAGSYTHWLSWNLEDIGVTQILTSDFFECHMELQIACW